MRAQTSRARDDRRAGALPGRDPRDRVSALTAGSPACRQPSMGARSGATASTSLRR